MTVITSCNRYFSGIGKAAKRLITLPKRSGRLLEKQKKEPLKHEQQQKRKLRDKNGVPLLLEVCISWIEGVRGLERSTPTKPRGLRGNTSKRYTQSEPKPDCVSKDLELEKQEQKLREPEKLPEYELKTRQANFGGDKAAVSPSIEAKASMDQGHQMGLSIVCALPASQSRTNINSTARMPLRGSMSASPESRESGEILLRSLKHSTPRKPRRGLWRSTPKRFTQSEPKPDGMSEGLELEMQEQQLEYELMTKQAYFGGVEATVSPL
ncbi:uncharacterized protein LOC120183257 [Hibiscus syriacus]|uniref:uncharacterized protein LOC120183257 n=1 Tax=Hibiscus syriacus TaxID=106335 RepID=UPI001924CD0D|nr:uncharacterized protein LOC120183257 [Hibiscus syriacus]